jgi:predicted RNase H-like HicB family nuclease
MNEYVVICERADDGGWSGYLPDVPGVVVAGGSPEEVEQLMEEALALHREELASRGEVPPPPRSTAGKIAV